MAFEVVGVDVDRLTQARGRQASRLTRDLGSRCANHLTTSQSFSPVAPLCMQDRLHCPACHQASSAVRSILVVLATDPAYRLARIGVAQLVLLHLKILINVAGCFQQFWPVLMMV